MATIGSYTVARHSADTATQRLHKYESDPVSVGKTICGAVAQAARRKAARAGKMVLHKYESDSVSVGKTICGAVAQAARNRVEQWRSRAVAN